MRSSHRQGCEGHSAQNPLAHQSLAQTAQAKSYDQVNSGHLDRHDGHRGAEENQLENCRDLR